MRESVEHYFDGWDGAKLFYRHWPAATKSDKAIVLFHRGHEHSARWQDVIEKLDMPDAHIFAWDARGHGNSPGERGYAESFSALARDADCFVKHVSQQHMFAIEDIVVMAHSVGSVIAATWVHDYAPKIRALVLGSPALRIRLYVPFAIPGLRVLNKLRPKSFISSYVKGKLLTHDQEKAASYDNDPLVTRNIAVNVLLGLHDASSRLLTDAGAITVPTLVLTSGDDWVVRQKMQKEFFNGLSSSKKRMRIFPGFFHDTFNEKDNHLPIAEARQFMIEAFEGSYEPANVTDADKHGYTRLEYDELSSKIFPLCYKNWGYKLMALGMKTVGRLSDSMRLGWKLGFDSGAMLDYVYLNKAQGITPIGKLIDRAHLDSAGWKGIRQRKVHLELALREVIDNMQASQSKVRVLDIATGQGRYVLDVLQDYPNAQALLRDYSPINIEAGNKHVAERGISNVRYEEGNAFDADSVRSASEADVAIVSGLYELFPDNDLLRTSLGALAAVVPQGGYLIYTNQPWHPQMELIARVLTSHRDGEPWIMRRRTQQEMDQLVAQAGFIKEKMAIDDDGIFTVSVARRG
ncbi:MAG: bifunctional alpha/beta hydrolase/class I SAM-dependent methyltransferase [Alphaproteobacteria bacterium]|nr:bifunctional alpha/beta hydrolase/class I SAM-dependent methyltransferase [Alphaproteobacteria bacterium]